MFQRARCRRLVLVATATGGLMVPARPSVLVRMVTPRHYLDRGYLLSDRRRDVGLRGAWKSRRAHARRLFVVFVVLTSLRILKHLCDRSYVTVGYRRSAQ